MYVVGQKMPFLDPAFFLLGQFPEYFAQMIAQSSVQNLAPTFRDKNYMLLALLFRVA